MPNMILNSNGSPEQTYARQKLAEAITAKGVPTDPKAPFNVMAENVGNIVQTQYHIDGTTIRDAQEFSDGMIYNLWDVFYQLKNDARIQLQYPSFLLCQYYKGYDSIDLSQLHADAYITSDGDFYDYNTTHYWHDSDSNKCDRWVALLYVQGGLATFTIPSESLCPRKLFVGGHFGTIESNAVGRISEIIVPDEIVDGVQQNTLISTSITGNQNWAENVVIKNLLGSASQRLIVSGTKTNFLSIFTDKLLLGSLYNYLFRCDTATIINIQAKSIDGGGGNILSGSDSTIEFHITGLKESNSTLYDAGVAAKSVKHFFADDLESTTYSVVDKSGNAGSYAGNKPLVSISLKSLKHSTAEAIIPKSGMYSYTNHLVDLIDIEVGEMVTDLNIVGWNPANVIADPTKLAQLNTNIRDHIAAKVSDRTGQTALTFTVSANLYANLEQATIDAFTTKNWNVAGA